MRATLNIAKFLMRTWETRPVSPEIKVGLLNEVFSHSMFLDGSEENKRLIMLQSSESKYKDEQDYPWDNYFGIDLRLFLKNQVALDLGCFTGGRSVAWFERYQLRHLIGIDVKQVFIDAAKQFAQIKRADACFEVAKGEVLPFADECVDAVLSFDVFEHVQNVQKALHECYRVLKPGGRLFVVFPSYYQPVEHHIALVTNFPCIHYFFSANTLLRAYCEILSERGHEAYWYKRGSSQLEKWERGNTINGTTLAQFQKYVGNHAWKIILQSRKPIGSVGRNISKNKIARGISTLLSPLTLVPGLREIFLHRITYILQKI